jgi:hypothetical protein
MKLTTLEAKVLWVTRNYNDLESQMADNFSNAGIDEIAIETGLDRKTIEGAIGSLTKKGAGYYDPDEDLLWINEKALPTLWEMMG